MFEISKVMSYRGWRAQPRPPFRIAPVSGSSIPSRLPACLFLLVALSPLGSVSASAQASPPHSHAPWEIGVSAALIATFMADRAIREETYLESDGRWEGLARVGNRLGQPQYSLPVLGVLYGVGRVEHNSALTAAAEHTSVALLAAGAANGALKVLVGRERPHRAGDADVLHPLNFDNQWQSFPSGHTVVAFSLATALSEEAGRPWVSALAYGTAGMVGWSRVYQDKHWASDVVAGAVVGTVVSRATIHWLHGRDADGSGARVTLLPAGVVVTIPVR